MATAMGTQLSAPSLFSNCCQATASSSSHCSTNASALPQQSTSMLSVTSSHTLCGGNILARKNSRPTGKAETLMTLRGSTNCTSRLDFRSRLDSRSVLGRGVVWSDRAGMGMQLVRGSVSVSSSSGKGSATTDGEEVYFDGGVHFGDLVTNLVFGLTLVWLPLTLAAIFRNLFLRYRFTNKRITIQSGLIGGDRKDFTYDVVTDVKVVPRFIGEWGDMALELRDGTKVDLRSVPKFREIAKYVEEQAASAKEKKTSVLSPSGSSRKGFS